MSSYAYSQGASLHNKALPFKKNISTGIPFKMRQIITDNFTKLWKQQGEKRYLRDENNQPVNITPSALAVFISLFDDFHNSKTGQCNPSYKTIAKKIGKTSRTVERAVRSLIKVGVIRIVRRNAKKGKDCRVPYGNSSNQFYLVKGAARAMVEILKAHKTKHPIQRSLREHITFLMRDLCPVSTIKEILAAQMPTKEEIKDFAQNMKDRILGKGKGRGSKALDAFREKELRQRDLFYDRNKPPSNPKDQGYSPGLASFRSDRLNKAFDTLQKTMGIDKKEGVTGNET